MAYGIFARRKVYLTNYIFTMQAQLEDIMDQKQKLINFTSNIADGVVTTDELVADPTNYQNYADFFQGYAAFKETSDAEGGGATTWGAIMEEIANSTTDEQQKILMAECLNKSFSTEYANLYSKKLDALENQLDIQQQKLQTKLSAAEKQLEQVEQAEAKAIDRATPKYDGIG